MEATNDLARVMQAETCSICTCITVLIFLKKIAHIKDQSNLGDYEVIKEIKCISV